MGVSCEKDVDLEERGWHLMKNSVDAIKKMLVALWKWVKIQAPVVWEAIKEPLREIVLAAIPGALAYLQTINLPWAIGLYLLLRGIDSWLHEEGKVKENPTLVTGITRF